MFKAKSTRFILACALAGGTASAAAQGFPSQVVRILHPYSTGSGPDIAARMIAENLSRQWSQQVIVEARPGASGFIGLEAAKNSPANGHYLTLIGLAHMAMNPGLYKKLPYDWERDFDLVGLVFKTPFFITVQSGDKYKSVADLIAAARKTPGKIAYATPYVGSPIHLGAALFESMTDTRMLHVPYNDQTQVFVSIVNGDVDWTLGTVGSAGALLRGGRVKLLAIASKTRLASQPEVPTVVESGGPAGYEVDSWVGLAAPKGTPPAIVARINADLARALADPNVIEKFKGLGYEAAPSSPAEFGDLARRDEQKYTELIRRIGVTAQ